MLIIFLPYVPKLYFSNVNVEKLDESSRTTLPFRCVCLWRHNHFTRQTGRAAYHPTPCGWHVQLTMLFRYRRHRNVNGVYTISCQHHLHRCTILFTLSTSRCERCIHDIVSTSFTSMYYPVYIVDIALWTMYTWYRVNIIYIDVLSCLHCRHRDVKDVYTILCQHHLHRCTIMLTLLTLSISRCERCIHNIMSTSFTSMYYHVYIVHIVDIVIHEMNGNFGLFCLFVVGRDVLSLSVPQSVNIYHLRGNKRKCRFTHQILLRPASFVCVFLWRYNIRTSFRANVMDIYCD